MDDLISRETVRETLQMYIPGFKWDTIDKIVDMMPSAQPEKMQLSREDATFDCISRQTAIDAVETKIKKWNAVDGEGYHVGLGLRYTDVIDTLTELPSAQPQIIMCKDCKHSFLHNNGEKTSRICGLTRMCGTTPDDWYCGDAERRIDGQDD